MDISKESLLSLAHEALLDDPLAIGQLNDLFIDHDLKKINVPNYKCRQNSYDSLVIDSKLQELLDQEDDEHEFQQWLSAVLTIKENGTMTRNNMGSDFDFYINYGIEWKDVYKVHLGVFIENVGDYSTISVDVANIVKFDSITSIIVDLLRYLAHPIDVSYLYRILYEHILYGKQDRDTIYQSLRTALLYLIVHKEIIEDDSNTKNLIDDNNKFILNKK